MEPFAPSPTTAPIHLLHPPSRCSRLPCLCPTRHSEHRTRAIAYPRFYRTATTFLHISRALSTLFAPGQELTKSYTYKQSCKPHEHAATAAAGNNRDVCARPRTSRPGTSATRHRHSHNSANIVHAVGITTNAVYHLHTDCDGRGHHDRDRDRDRDRGARPNPSASITSNLNPFATANADANGSAHASHDKQPHRFIAGSACANTIR